VGIHLEIAKRGPFLAVSHSSQRSPPCTGSNVLGQFYSAFLPSSSILSFGDLWQKKVSVAVKCDNKSFQFFNHKMNLWHALKFLARPITDCRILRSKSCYSQKVGGPSDPENSLTGGLIWSIWSQPHSSESRIRSRPEGSAVNASPLVKMGMPIRILFSLFSDTPSIYIGGMWTRGSRLREEGAASGQREGPLLARSI